MFNDARRYSPINLDRGSAGDASTIDIFTNPMEIFRQGDGIGSVGGYWHAFFKAVQLADENNPDTVDFMIVPQIESVRSPSNISQIDAVPAARAILTFLDLYDNVSAGYNISADNPNKVPEGKPKPPQTLGLWHIHLTRFPKEMERVNELSSRLDEQIPETTLKSLQTSFDLAFADYISAKIISDPEKRGLFPIGGVVIECGGDISDLDVIDVLQKIDRVYKDYFEENKSVINSGFRSATYSVAILKRDGRIRILFKPHFNQQADWLNAMGIVTERIFISPDAKAELLAQAANTKRRERAREVFQAIKLRMN